MGFGQTTRAKGNLLIGVTVCVAVVAAIAISRGGRGTRARRDSTGSPLPGSVSVEPSLSSLPVIAPSLVDWQKNPTSLSLSGRIAQELTAIQALTDLDRQARELQKLVDQITVADIPGVLSALDASDRHSLDSEFRILLVTRWASSDATSASAWVEENVHDSARLQALNTVGLAWVDKDRNAATEWARHLSEADERGGVLESLAYEISRNDAAAASALVTEIPTGSGRDDLVSHVAALWAADSPAKASDWAAGLPTEELRQGALAAVATAWADSDPVSAGTLAVRSLAPGKMQDDAVISVVQRWVQKDPTQAAAWVNGFSEGSLRDTAVEELVKLWAAQDLQQAGQWLNDFAPGQSRDVAVGAYVGSIAPLFPKVAAEWIDNIQDDTLRYSEIERVAEIWLSNDANSARAWIAEASLPDERKARLLALKSE